MIRASLLALAFSASAALAPSAQADGVYWSLGIGSPGVAANFGNVYPVAPPPVYVAPPPVVYAQPPVVYSPGYVTYGAYGRDWHPYWGDRRGWRRHHEDDDDDN
ncbi:MAG: hypothetical protein ACYC3R_06715 [Thiomonas delicata]|uniref:Putative Glutelin n=1 Tax=Thiomonas delicata TaxID=364030 RepID=A0A238D491_THIDL|nr:MULTISPECIES: hypothetical protein [Thiomonas]OZB44596.1 MAG: hypothetical protein B7X46_08035 [Thiomonas sp. 15-66-11]SBP88113.1 putative Glutelin [Thiomonas delicata]